MSSDMLVSIETAYISEMDATNISKRFASIILERYLPGETSLYLYRKDAPFGKALEYSLRVKGYPISIVEDFEIIDNPPSFMVTYEVSDLEETWVLIRVQVGPDFMFGRVYTRNGESLTPKSNFTIREKSDER
ncbi:MAG: hypothetical protein HRT90_11995 [Candidatus Margulisbacteria bacterium]|nr:hypothetical protein [Candidatus Margulisiibacteriota bacterium]